MFGSGEIYLKYCLRKGVLERNDFLSKVWKQSWGTAVFWSIGPEITPKPQTP